MSNDTSKTFQQALALHQRGDVASARKLYEQILRQTPHHFDSLHLLGLTHVQEGALELGVRYIAEAIEVRPDFAEAHYNLGNALLSLGKPERALASLERAIALSPRDPVYHFERGNALKELGRRAEAKQSFEAALHLAPRYAEAHNNIGILLKDDDRFAEALGHYDKAISLKPRYAEAHSNRGNVLKELERFAEALASHDEALRLKPDYAEAHSNRGIALARLDRLEEALASHDRALQLKPDSAEAHNNRGNALKDLGRLDEALESYEHAIRLKPDHAEAYSNRAGALGEQGRLAEALASHDTAIALKPDSAEAWCSRGNTLVDLEQLDEALASYDKAISLRTSFAMARYNKSLLCLRRRALAEGFELYMSRWAAEKPGARGPTTAIPRWTGELGGDLLLWAEQGLGDEVFFASLLSLLDPAAMKVTVSADRRLHPLLARSFPHISLVSRETTEQSVAGPFAAQAAMGDLGFLLHLDAGRIAGRRYPYFAADPERREQLRHSNPFPAGKLVCGLSWRSGNKTVGKDRSIALVELAPLLRLPRVSFVNLQYGTVEQDIAEAAARLGTTVHMAHDVDLFSDIDGLVALIDRCDVVVTIDNVTAHLAGAIGKPAAVLVPTGRSRHWYWGGEGQSLWYPSLRLFYHDPGTGWTGALDEVARWLASFRAAPDFLPGAEQL